ncbi:MAG: 50S ribosomal protein L3 [bacterium]
MVIKGILGRKIGMTQIFDEGGNRIPVTVIKSDGCKILKKKIQERDGYNSLVLGFEEVKESKLNKPLRGFFKKLGSPYYKILKEIRVDSITEDLKEGEIITVGIFKPGDKVDVTGISKGKGFAGGVKRWHFSGGGASHGSMFHRAPGSIGASSYPSRVFKGHHFPGRMGGETVTVRSLDVVKVYEEEGLILVKGAIPGPRNNIIIIRDAKKAGKGVEANE